MKFSIRHLPLSAALLLPGLVALVSLSACAEDQATKARRPVIVFIGTKEADSHIKKLKLSPEQAAAALLEAAIKKRIDSSGHVWACRFICGNVYVFAYGGDRGLYKLPVCGFYVDGLTGEIRDPTYEDIGKIYGETVQINSQLSSADARKAGYKGKSVKVSTP